MEENRKVELNLENEIKEEQTNVGEVLIDNQTDAAAIVPKKKSVFLIVWQVIVALLFISVTAFLTFLFLDVINAPPPDEGSIDGRGLGLAVFIILAVIIGGIGYIANVVTSIVGIVVSVMNRKKGTCGIIPLIYFIVFTILPIITFIFWMIVPRFVSFS